MMILTSELAFHTLATEMREVLPADLITALGVDAQHETLQRLYTNEPEKYTLGAQWALLPSHWREVVIREGRVLTCKSPEQILAGYRDGAEILGHEYGSAISIPILLRAKVEKRVVGVMNLLFDKTNNALSQGQEAHIQQAMRLVEYFSDSISVRTDA
jgi:GAF domain-containing protein